MIQLEWVDVMFMLLFFLAGMICNYRAGKAYGVQHGINSTISYLEKQKFIKVSKDGDISQYYEEEVNNNE